MRDRIKNLFLNCVAVSVTTPRMGVRSRFSGFAGVGLGLTLLAGSSMIAAAQTGGEAGIQGTVTDSTGAAIPGATVVVTNTATGVTTTRQTTGDGLYTISPVIPGIYTVAVTSPGFSKHVQSNLTVDALKFTALNVAMEIGAADQSVNVTTEPPLLETTNATLGLTIENSTYSALPLQMNGAQRDPTAFGSLAPGAQGGARLPIIGGTGNYLGQLYLDGLPAETINQQADNRVVSQAVSVDAIDQTQIITSTPPAEYSGAGASNFTMKSGGLGYHGQVSDFIRNTSLDAWGFSVKAQTIKNAAGVTVPAPKPIDHQNELSASFGGHVPGTNRIFFFVAYDKYHNRSVKNPASYTIPSALEKMGDFTELNGGVGTGGLSGTGANNPAFLFDPTSTNCVGNVCTRQPFQGIKNGVPTNNVIPTSYISPISKAAESFLPDPNNAATLVNNYTSGLNTGFDNHSLDYRVDFDVSPKHRISTIGAMGTVQYLNNYGAPYLPQPYTGGDLAAIFPKVYDVEDSYQIRPSISNQLKFGFVRFFMNIQNSTQGVTQYQANTLGITNLPVGQAATEFPGISFASTPFFGTAQQTYTGNSNATSTQITTPNNFTLVDNISITRGRHAITAGIQVQWQEINNANPATFTGVLSLPFTGYSTANFAANSNALTLGTATAGSGYSYASFLLGAVGNAGTVAPSIGLQPVSELGGRYRPIAPYIEDTWKVNSKLTVDAGLRWDYLPPFHEVKDRWSFLNPTLTNPGSGTPGAIQFAGNLGGAGASCGCRTPVKTYWKNWGPRVGITFSPDDKTVFRIGAGRVYSQGGGVGGRVGAANGTGQLGLNVTATGPSEITTGANAGPSFYLNNSSAFQALGKANTSLFGAGYQYPTAPTPGSATEALNAGNYVNGAGAFVTPQAVSYADPYFSGRAPNFMFYNAGVQRSLTNDMTLAINYVGNQSHHLYNSTVGGANIRGYWSNQLNPIYLAGLGGVSNSAGTAPLLTAAATPANVAKAQAAMPGISIPASYQAAAVSNSSATIAQALVAFPQYSGVTDTWGVNVGNFSYNSLQVTLQQRFHQGVTFNFNYTWSKNIGDDGTFRSGFDIPGAAISGGGKSYKQDRIERGNTTVSQPHVIHAYGVWELPFGKGKFGGNHLVARAIASGWQLSGIYTYAVGTPVAVTWTACAAGNYPLQGQCMPNVNPNFTKSSARINGGYGQGAGGRTACNLGVGTGCVATKYIDGTAFSAVPSVSGLAASPIYLLGNAPRTSAFNLSNPGAQNIDTSLRRTIALHDKMNLQVEVDCLNTWNHTIFSSPVATFGSTTFGTVTSTANSPRDFQLAGHFNF
ncbi:TonB-dependent receptor [Granulicella tundricola]|uniref:TonB-dependent transporter Oar-like beta-barrel domain-containing protein n=1 Tax=Granulicella tundricola (strain ATCC BAA-1859 / DSM 23138 / MP5ACTX9) TaxID=1198114 RepID=E8X173_GRATM|nr:TonB-dependent receptor [Granulicella tundricola]ADW67939.1 hypothetical protein AciX9_0871 [Granulicella tundricola MP5ACTX9]